MRGKACGLFQLVESPGITPAYAGKREGPKNAQSKVGDHPRVCGEKEICRKTQNIVPGSPPRMRGKASSHFCTCSTFGITPAYAGKSTCSFGHPLASRDHPRVCGEKSGLMRSNATGTGSPPRMRGKGLVPYVPRLVQGITPAYAGKRGRGTCPRPCGWDHPRVCGEKGSSHAFHGRKTGSPPRMRGKD